MNGVDTPCTMPNRIPSIQTVMTRGSMITSPVKKCPRRLPRNVRVSSSLLTKATPGRPDTAAEHAQLPGELHEIVRRRQRRHPHDEPDGEIPRPVPGAEEPVSADQQHDRHDLPAGLVFPPDAGRDGHALTPGDHAQTVHCELAPDDHP